MAMSRSLPENNHSPNEDGGNRGVEHPVPAKQLHDCPRTQGGKGRDTHNTEIVQRLDTEAFGWTIGSGQKRRSSNIEEIPADAERHHGQAVVQHVAARQARNQGGAKQRRSPNHHPPGAEASDENTTDQ